ncbi:MAG: RidA family protein [Bdellovibrionaceae bacterium]|nr:RidA family protein [Pseudobdellovibrionaceae bacterium]MDW8190428.1 RidA family protein [Pseudobdellovibrionaceae bacterium]
MNPQIIKTDTAPQAIGPYSQAVRVGPFLWCSGQIALLPNGEHLFEKGIEEQTEQVLKNIENILSAAGYQMQHIVKTTIFLKEMSDFQKVNEIYGRYFPVNPPARSTVAVKELPRGAKVEIEVIAYKG